MGIRKAPYEKTTLVQPSVCDVVSATKSFLGVVLNSLYVHKSVLAMGKLRDLHCELLEHPHYSPDLAPSDFCLFPEHKLLLVGQRFSSNQEAIAAVEGYFADLTKNHYRDGIMALEHRWNKCISLKGDYVEK